jgi:hypothetical protein
MTEHLSGLKCSGQTISKGRVSLFLVFKQNLNLSYWCIWLTKNHKERIKIEKFMASQIRGVKTSKKQTTEGYKADS